MTDTEILAPLATLLFVILMMGITLISVGRQLYCLRHQIELRDYHLDRLFRAAAHAADAYHRVRHNGNAADRLALDQAMAELANVAESARKREPLP